MKNSTSPRELLGPFALSGRGGKPKHVQVSGFLRALVMNGLVDGERFFTERELIDALGVSQPTVRSAMKTLVDEGLLDRQVGRGTFVRKPAFPRVFGVLMPHYDSAVNVQMMNAVGDEAGNHGLGLQPFYVHKGESIEGALGGLSRFPGIKAVFLIGCRLDVNREAHALLAEGGVTAVTIGWQPESSRGCCVGVDSRLGARLALEHLLAMGHRHIAVLQNEPHELGAVAIRERCIKMVANEHPEATLSFTDCKTPSWADSSLAAYDAMPRVMEQTPRPTAILAIDDEGAAVALRYLHERGIRVPDDVAVMGFNNSPMSASVYPSLTTVARPFKEIAREAIALAERNFAAPRRVFAQPKLIVRESTDPRCTSRVFEHSEGVGTL